MAPKARTIWGLHSLEKCLEEVWDLVIAGIWKECVSSLCHELSLHCHCLNNDFKAPFSLPDDSLCYEETQGLSREGLCPLGKGLSAVPDKLPAGWGRLGTQGHGSMWDLLCLPGSHLCQYLAAINTPRA